MSQRTLTLAILIDALRHDYIIQEDAPFLHAEASAGTCVPVSETYGFQTRPAYFAGLHPDRSDIANLYVYDPKRSPFRIFRWIPRPIRRMLERSPIQRQVRTSLRLWGQWLQRRRGLPFAAAITDTAKIPFDRLPQFAISEEIDTQAPGALPSATLFDLLREHGMEWRWVAYPTSDQRTGPIEAEAMKAIDAAPPFIYLHYAELDWAGHAHGPNAPERRATMREIDASVARVVAAARERFDVVHLVVFGDHGMVEVNKTIDPTEPLAELRARFGDRVTWFIDSTQLRLWGDDDHVRSESASVLAGFDGASVLDAEALSRLRAVKSRRYGDVHVLADAGYVFLPNDFQGSAPVCGMHGYDPSARDNDGALLVVPGDDSIRLGPVDSAVLVDIFPTLALLLDLPVPSTQEGESLVQRA